MPHHPRICIAALLALLPAAMAWAIDAAPSQLEPQKMQAVQQALASAPGTSAESAGILARVPAAAAIIEVRVENRPNEVSLIVMATGAPSYETSKLNHGRQLVLDFHNAIDLCAPPQTETAWPEPLQSVKTLLAEVQPRFISRVTIDLSVACPYFIEREDDALRITFQKCPAAGTDSLSLAAAPEPFAALAEQLASVRAESDGRLRSSAAELPVFDSVLTEVRIERILDDLASVASPELRYSPGSPSLYAATNDTPEVLITTEAESVQEDSATETPATDTEAPDSAAPESSAPAPEPEPVVEAPPKREVAPVVDTTAANAAIAESMRTLIKTLTTGADPAAEQGLTVSGGKASAESLTLATKPWEASKAKAAGGNPLDQLVDFECDEMPLTKVVPLLAYKAGINVVAGADLVGNVTMSLRNVPLRKAMETALRMNGLGMVEEENIYRIVPYEEAISTDRTTVMVTLQNAQAEDVRKVLDDILKRTRDEQYINLSANKAANVVVVSGPEDRIQALVAMSQQLDVAEPVLPTVTVPIKLNYAEPDQMVKMVEKMITPKVGNVTADERARHLIITDAPVVVEQIRELVTSLDVPVKQVLIDAMVVDAALNDEAETGVDWLMRSLRSQSFRDFIEQGPDGRKIGNVQQLDLATVMPLANPAGNLMFGLLTDNIDWRGVLQAEVRNRNGHLISNPVVVTVENKPATITISQEIPYIELSQTSAGGSQTNTQFKNVGTVLEVTPRVTHDNHVIVDLSGKESATSGEFNGIPIEDQRKVESTLRMNNGQTIFVGGLRKRSDNNTVRKLPVLGNIPVVNFLFRTNARTGQVNELMIFLTCTVIEDEMPALMSDQQDAYDTAKGADGPPGAERQVLRDFVHPNQSDDPSWKWRRAK